MSCFHKNRYFTFWFGARHCTPVEHLENTFQPLSPTPKGYGQHARPFLFTQVTRLDCGAEKEGLLGHPLLPTKQQGTPDSLLHSDPILFWFICVPFYAQVHTLLCQVVTVPRAPQPTRRSVTAVFFFFGGGEIIPRQKNQNRATKTL